MLFHAQLSSNGQIVLLATKSLGKPHTAHEQHVCHICFSSKRRENVAKIAIKYVILFL